MLGITALIDIFWWAPFFSLWAGIDNQDCTGGWFTGQPRICQTNYVKSYGRLFVTIQCLMGGMFYLSSAITAWSEYYIRRDHHHQNAIVQQKLMVQEWMQHQQLQQQLPKK